MPTVADRLMDATRGLPETLVAEVLDFAEFLRTRQGPMSASAPDLPLTLMCGGLSESTAFKGDPVDIQQALRDEWP